MHPQIRIKKTDNRVKYQITKSTESKWILPSFSLFIFFLVEEMLNSKAMDRSHNKSISVGGVGFIATVC